MLVFSSAIALVNACSFLADLMTYSRLIFGEYKSIRELNSRGDMVGCLRTHITNAEYMFGGFDAEF
jgi:hypothetical protein